MARDLRDTIFGSLDHRPFTAEVRVTSEGLICGVELARRKAEALGCEVLHGVEDGVLTVPDDAILVFRGTAKAVAMAEDCVPGAIGKLSGIARAARQARDLAAGRLRVVSGAAKKMPAEIKEQVRRAVQCGGGHSRMVEGPFLYLDKNYVRMFGGVRQTLAAVSGMQGYTRIIQLRGLMEDIAGETRIALEMGADILMIDTGSLADLDQVASLVREADKRGAIRIAFAGDIALDDIPLLATHDVDILDIGKAVIDAPMVDIKFDVVPNGARPSQGAAQQAD